MGRFDGRKVPGHIYFNHPEDVSLPIFDQIQNRRGIVKDGIAIEIDLIGLYWVEVPIEAAIESSKEAITTLDANDRLAEDEIDEDNEDDEVQEAKETPLTASRRTAWLVQVRYTTKKMSAPAIRKFLKQVEEVTKENKYHEPQGWYVCKGGFTKPARKLLKEAGFLCSDRAQFNKLANLFGFFGLPA
jgi:hypothetical protein